MVLSSFAVPKEFQVLNLEIVIYYPDRPTVKFKGKNNQETVLTLDLISNTLNDAATKPGQVCRFFKALFYVITAFLSYPF